MSIHHFYLAKFKKAQQYYDYALAENKKLVKQVNKLNLHLRNIEDELKKQKKINRNMYYELDRDRDIYMCQICFEKPRNTVLLPCRHFYCAKCVSSFELESCPCCRQKIEGVLEVII